MPEFLRKAVAAGQTTSLNPQYDASGRWSNIEALCPSLTFLICHEKELRLMSHLGKVTMTFTLV